MSKVNVYNNFSADQKFLHLEAQNFFVWNQADVRIHLVLIHVWSIYRLLTFFPLVVGSVPPPTEFEWVLRLLWPLEDEKNYIASFQAQELREWQFTLSMCWNPVLILRNYAFQWRGPWVSQLSAELTANPKLPDVSEPSSKVNVLSWCRIEYEVSSEILPEFLTHKMINTIKILP